jgi:pantoate--beta-alanine ligase
MSESEKKILRLEDPERALIWCRAVREKGSTLGFVPTMGALHDGHLSLIERARAENDQVCASVFVNPLQFNERSDFERYPRDFDGDARLLGWAGCAMVFTGTLATFFPGRVAADGTFDPRALLDPGPCALGLEGEHRPGHFAGVATIVARLFDVAEPTRAYFGAKDYQQTLVVRDLARVRGSPEIRVCPTIREPSGLARSSRNERLSPAERETATVLVRALRAARDEWRAGRREAASLRARMSAVLAGAPVAVEYAALRDPERWTADEPKGCMQRAVALIAARVGGVRLIDNLRLDAEDGEA